MTPFFFPLGFSTRFVSFLPFAVSLFLYGFSTRFRFLSSPFCFSQFWYFSPFVLRPLFIFPLLFLFSSLFLFMFFLLVFLPCGFCSPFRFFLTFFFLCPLVSSPFCFCLTLWFFSLLFPQFSLFHSSWFCHPFSQFPCLFLFFPLALCAPSLPFLSFLLFGSCHFCPLCCCPCCFPFVFLCYCLSLFLSFYFFLFPNSRTVMWYKKCFICFIWFSLVYIDCNFKNKPLAHNFRLLTRDTGTCISKNVYLSGKSLRQKETAIIASDF